MDTDKYIASGILELYVLGALNRQEEQEVERIAHTQTKIAEEIKRLQCTLEDFAEAHAQAPPPELKAKILESLTKSSESTIPPATVAIDRQTPQKWYSMPAWAIAAIIIFALVSIALNLFLYFRLQDVEKELSSIKKDNSALASNLAVYKSRENKLLAEQKFITRSHTQKVLLIGIEDQDRVTAVIYWNKDDGAVMLHNVNLAPAPAGEQYQLWAIVDGKPLDAGLVVYGSGTARQEMKSIENAQAFAITCEPLGGSVIPTLTKMYAKGSITN
ncbi:MAG: anti-sigma factor [Bacteroidota bacterium]|nr:anti-sigma factor [Bacteroidota bacterium]